MFAARPLGRITPRDHCIGRTVEMSAVACTQLDGSSIAVTIGWDDTLRAWVYMQGVGKVVPAR